MLDEQMRAAILALHKQGHGIKAISRTLNISRKAVREVIRSGTGKPPQIRRSERLQEHLDLIRDQYKSCEGNLVRVHEELVAKGVAITYSTLTRFCRLHEIGTKPRPYAGQYIFSPGEEMQHDTSPHTVEVGGRRLILQCASLVLCFCRMLFAQLYRTFDRFWCKVFLTDALRYFGGAASRCMVDNTSVVVVSGTGEKAVIAAEMEAFADRFGFKFKAHEVGDANRSARVERPFGYIERNFYPGRSFADMADVNRQMVGWCDKVNRRYKKHIRAVPIELFQAERVHLVPLPIYVPEPQLIHLRTVDVEGYVNLHTNRYSVHEGLLGRPIEVRETKEKVLLFLGPRLVVEHERLESGAGERVTLPEHRYRGRWSRKGNPQLPIPQERVLCSAGGQMAALVELLKTKHRGGAARAIKRLHRLYLDYPTEPLMSAADEALRYGLCDLERLERMVLRNIDGEFFRLSEIEDEEDSDG